MRSLLLGCLVAAVAAADPVLTLSPGSIGYQVNEPAAIIDAAGLITHADNPAHLSGYTLTVSVISTTNSNGDPVAPDTGDILSVTTTTIPTGTGIATSVQVTTSGAQVLAAPITSPVTPATVVATWTGGTGTTDLELMFTRDATLPLANAVVRALTYANQRGSSAVVGQRTVGMVLASPVGGSTPSAAQTGVRVVVSPAMPSAIASTQSVLEDVGGQGTVTGSDPGLAPLTFAIATQPAQATVAMIDSSSGTYRVTPIADWTGTTSFTFTTSNGAATSVPATVTITVTPVNDRPSFRVTGNQTVDADGQPRSIPAWATAIVPGGGPDEAQQAISFTVTTTRPDLYLVAPAVDAHGTLTFTPAVRSVGTATISVVAIDDGGSANAGINTSVAASATITMRQVPVAPIVAPVVIDTIMGMPVVVTPTGTIGPGTAQWSMVGASTLGTLTIDATTGVVRMVPALPGTETVQAAVMTDEGSTTFPIQVTITDPRVQGAGPVLVTTPDQESVVSGTPWVYDCAVAAVQTGAVFQGSVEGVTGATITKTGGNTFRVTAPTTGFAGYMRLHIVIADTTSHTATGQVVLVRVMSLGGQG